MAQLLPIWCPSRSNLLMNTAFSPVIAMVVAMTDERVIGKNNQLLWRLPADLKHFKQLTTGHPIIMGRKTYESIGKALPNRTNIVITRDPMFNAADCTIVNSIPAALSAAMGKKSDIFIIGGAEIYQEFLPLTRVIYLTLVHHHFDGDTFFPPLNLQEWHEQERQDFTADEQNPYNYSFITLKRVNCQ